jgi:hypothetical protein
MIVALGKDFWSVTMNAKAETKEANPNVPARFFPA